MLKCFVLTYLSETTKQNHGAGPCVLKNCSHTTDKIFYLFTFYLTTLTVAQIIRQRMEERLTNDEFESVRKESVVAYFEVLFWHVRGGSKKLRKTSVTTFSDPARIHMGYLLYTSEKCYCLANLLRLTPQTRSAAPSVDVPVDVSKQTGAEGTLNISTALISS